MQHHTKKSFIIRSKISYFQATNPDKICTYSTVDLSKTTGAVTDVTAPG